MEANNTTEYDISDQVASLLESKKKYVSEQGRKVPNLERWYEIQIFDLQEQRFGQEPPYTASFEGNIPLRGFYALGWDAAERGYGNEMPANIYLFDGAARKAIEQVHAGQLLEKRYYERLNAVAHEEYIEGVCGALLYHWLKDCLYKLKYTTEANISPQPEPLPLLQWNAPANTLYTLFYDLLRHGVITWNGKGPEGAKMEIIRVLKAAFVDKDSKPLSVETAKQAFKPGTSKAQSPIAISPALLRKVAEKKKT